MISFNTSPNQAGSTIAPNRSIKDTLRDIGGRVVDAAVGTATDIFNNVLTGGDQGAIDVSRIGYNLKQDRQHLFNRNIYDVDDSRNGVRRGFVDAQLSGDTISSNNYENSLIMDPEIYGLMNMYRYRLNNGVMVPLSGYTWDENGKVNGYLYGEYDGGKVTPSLFNPYFGVQSMGMTANTPLTDNDPAWERKFNTSDFTDCSIMKLVSLSSQPVGELGQARYKYSDFMYCKDLGMPNNRMITLRRFAMPVGDNIFSDAAMQYNSNPGAKSFNAVNTPGDIGRLIGYFDTDENKLEDIINYEYDVTWENKESEFDQQHSKMEDNGNQSKLAALINIMSPQYKQQVIDGIRGLTANSWFGGKLNIGNTDWYNRNIDIFNRDKNKVYAPMNTVREMWVPTGKIEFRQEITLTFVYTLRSYDNINPKSAMLDLLGNILAVTATAGRFWGGSINIIGPQPNIAGWQKANAIINNAWDDIGGLLSSIKNSGGDFSALMGDIANMASIQDIKEGYKNIKEGYKNLKSQLSSKDGIKNFAGNVFSKIINSSTAFTDLGKGLTQNILGRSEVYMFNSMLTGDNTGLWHLTIGNPRNPIAVMGNMIMTNAKIQQFGPLGLDDFPTGIKVTVTLKHARPRDFVDIQKMYTRGTMAMYINMNGKSDGSKSGPETHYNLGITGPIYVGDWDIQRTKRNWHEIM